MRFNVIASIAAVSLFMAYFAPIMIKLRDVPLAIVLLGGIVLVVADVWQSMSDKAD